MLRRLSTRAARGAGGLSASEVVAFLEARRFGDVRRVAGFAAKSALADDMVLATGLSARQLLATGKALVSEAKARARTADAAARVALEADDDWVCVDLGPVVVQLFDAEARRRYAFDELWARRPPLEHVFGGDEPRDDTEPAAADASSEPAEREQ